MIEPTKNIDLIVAWPKHVDYPLWRQMIRDNRERFKKVIVVFTDMQVKDLDYRNFIKEAMAKDNVAFFDNDLVKAEDDWRNLAVNKALVYSDAEWIWFTEQDFIITDAGDFWDQVHFHMSNDLVDSISYIEGERLHPCCWFVRRITIEKTGKNFGVVKDKLDHFGLFGEELNRVAQNTVTFKPEGCFHLNGLSQNMHMAQQGEEPNFRPPVFQEYMKSCLAVQVPVHEDFKKLYHDLYSN